MTEAPNAAPSCRCNGQYKLSVSQVFTLSTDIFGMTKSHETLQASRQRPPHANLLNVVVIDRETFTAFEQRFLMSARSGQAMEQSVP